MNFNEINFLMDKALENAHQAARLDEVPVGAVIADTYGKIIAIAHNTKEKEQQACHHAEILALSEASKQMGSWRLNEHNLYVTLEPCPMCMAAILQARLNAVFFGAYDPKGGSVSLGYNFHKDKRLNHNFKVYGGFKHLECSKLVSDFFKQKRRRYKP